VQVDEREIRAHPLDELYALRAALGFTHEFEILKKPDEVRRRSLASPAPRVGDRGVVLGHPEPVRKEHGQHAPRRLPASV
jgi:hypothetical protein